MVATKYQLTYFRCGDCQRIEPEVQGAANILGGKSADLAKVSTYITCFFSPLKNKIFLGKISLKNKIFMRITH